MIDRWKSWMVFTFLFWVFSALLNLFVFSTCPCLLLLCSSSGCKFKHIDSVARDEQSTTHGSDTDCRKQKNRPFHAISQLGLWEQSLWRVKISSYGHSPHYCYIIVTRSWLNPWPYQCHWSEMHICPLGIVIAVACYSQISSKEKESLFWYFFKENEILSLS